jgi:uncharacterized membrane protein
VFGSMTFIEIIVYIVISGTIGGIIGTYIGVKYKSYLKKKKNNEEIEN